MRLYLLEPDLPGPAWAPFAGIRPIAELRAGAWLIRERWEAAVGTAASGIIGSHVAGFCDVDSPPVVDPGSIVGPAVVVRSTFVPPRVALSFSEGVVRMTHGGTTVAWLLADGERWREPHDEGNGHEVEGLPLRGAFDLVTALERLLASDCLEFTAAPADPIPAGSIVLGDPALVVCLDARVEPGVVFDTRRGAVVLTEGVDVRSGTRLEGPLFVGPGTVLLGGQLRRSAFGPHCRVHGEVSDTTMIGYANKSHDGFLGHSVLGHWVNLGAGTITSNLKNTYGEIRLELPGGRIETGRMNLGSLIADHAKTAIGTLLPTGAVIGAGANLFGATAVPKRVPPFAWGSEGPDRLDLEGFVRIAARVMPRRGVALTPERERWLRALYARATG